MIESLPILPKWPNTRDARRQPPVVVREKQVPERPSALRGILILPNIVPTTAASANAPKPCSSSSSSSSSSGSSSGSVDVSNPLTATWKFEKIAKGGLGYGETSQGKITIKSSNKKISVITFALCTEKGDCYIPLISSSYPSPKKWCNNGSGYSFPSGNSYKKTVNSNSVTISLCAWGGQRFKYKVEYSDGTYSAEKIITITNDCYKNGTC